MQVGINLNDPMERMKLGAAEKKKQKRNPNK